MLSAKQLDYAYRHEPDANVRERILLTRRVRVDNQEAKPLTMLSSFAQRYNRTLRFQTE